MTLTVLLAVASTAAPTVDSVLDGYVALRAGPRRVAFSLGLAPEDPDHGLVVAWRGHRTVEAPGHRTAQQDAALGTMGATLAPVGSTWRLHAGHGRLFSGRVVSHELWQIGCVPQVMAIVELVSTDAAAFAEVKEEYYFIRAATPRDAPAAKAAARASTWLDVKPRPAEQAVIRAVLQRELLSRLPAVSIDNDAVVQRDLTDPDGDHTWATQWHGIDARLGRGEGRLTLDVRALRLAATEPVRFLVLANWTLEDRRVAGFEAWFRRGDELQLEWVDDTELRHLRLPMFDYRPFHPKDEPHRFDKSPPTRVENVVDADGDGRLELLLLDTGYEGFSVQLHRYGEHGAEPVGAAYGGGC
jgi:hypothetical protein